MNAAPAAAGLPLRGNVRWALMFGNFVIGCGVLSAAAATGFMADDHVRERANIFVFLGWSVASVSGLPMSAWLGKDYGWRVAFDAIAKLAIWRIGAGLASVASLLIPWALGCFSSNSAQQARLSVTALVLAPALMTLNTSAIYLGQAVGAASGGRLIAHRGYAPLSGFGLTRPLVAIAVSLWAGRAGVVLA